MQKHPLAWLHPIDPPLGNTELLKNNLQGQMWDARICEWTMHKNQNSYSVGHLHYDLRGIKHFILFYFTLFYFILLFILFCFILLFCFIFYFILLFLFHFILFYFILFCYFLNIILFYKCCATKLVKPVAKRINLKKVKRIQKEEEKTANCKRQSCLTNLL